MSAYRQSAIGNHRRGLVVRTGLAHIALAAVLVAGCGTATPISSGGAPSALRTATAAAVATTMRSVKPSSTPTASTTASPVASATASASVKAPPTRQPVTSYTVSDCTSFRPPGWSVARYWDEEALTL